MHDAEPASLDEAGDGGMRARDEPAGMTRQQRAIVRDEPRESVAARFRHQGQGEAGLAGAGGAADQDAMLADHERRGVNVEPSPVPRRPVGSSLTLAGSPGARR